MEYALLFSTQKSVQLRQRRFLDLLPLINWLARSGFDVLQLLPLNETNSDARYVSFTFYVEPV